MHGDNQDGYGGGGPPAQETQSMSSKISQLTNALAKAQGRMSVAEKSSFNPHFKSRYADLASVWAACREPLAMYGLAVVQLVSSDGIAITVTTMLTHESGEWMRSAMTANARDTGPQAMGSVVTYLRRYSLSAMVGVATGDEDDDGQTTPNAGGGSNPGDDFRGNPGGQSQQVDKVALWGPRIAGAKTMTDLLKVAGAIAKESNAFSQRERDQLGVAYKTREAEIGPPKGKKEAPAPDGKPCGNCGVVGHAAENCPDNDGKEAAS